MTELPTADASDAHIWKPAKTFEDFALVCCGRLHMRLLSDPDSFSLCHRVGRIGPATVSEVALGADMALDAGEVCGAYRTVVLRAGHAHGVCRGLSLTVGPGAATVYPPQGRAGGKWSAGSRFLSFKLDRSAVDDALSDALGWQVMSQPDFSPVMPSDSAATRSWINMVALFRDQVFRPDSVLNQPLVGLPFVDSLVRGFLLAADHPHRDALAKDVRLFAPRAIRSAIEIIEEEAHLPLTLTSIATRTHISVRTLQQGFQRHLDTSPMAYLREVRLRRAHQALLRSDPSQVTVASVAYRWGFTNLGRFAAAHSARYRETPTETLRRRTFHRLTVDERVHVR
ncbi:AraC family transcriptional regulator [Mycobacterium sp. Aquia_213]|uniref:AraC family transcriptional regulator n=1 Tax=Mycobacterium sp. Aquia_213 TaxID=2991728 RepID=UPI00226F6937|nr:AraC family transcriptional regulator [Mycobacterium sp. Aquia_213]WAC90504.1 AraC family transcriptional regulator [Mycobacterium sp. Aquia_213]